MVPRSWEASSGEGLTAALFPRWLKTSHDERGSLGFWL